MTRREIEAEIAELESDLQKILIGYRGYAKAKETIEALIVKAKTQLSSLPEESHLERLRREYEMYGGNRETRDYITALEKCRPWVIKHRIHGGLQCSIEPPHGVMMFPTREKAVPYCDQSRCEIVQWEGDQ